MDRVAFVRKRYERAEELIEGAVSTTIRRALSNKRPDESVLNVPLQRVTRMHVDFS